MSSGLVDVLAFIGSSKTAEILKTHHPKPLRLRSILGLEAKNPAIVLPDADMQLAIRECLNGSLTFNGQRCTAIKIIFVHKKIVKMFLKKFKEDLKNLRIGMPWDENVVITPLPVPGKVEYLSELINDSIENGAKVINRSGGIFYKTLFYPALIYPVNEKMKIYHEEQFGPIVPVVPFDNIEEPVKYIIESSYGQQASIFGNDPEIIGKLVNILVNQVCRININSMCQRGPDIFPFAGRKDSGEGTLSVSDALRVFSMRTIVATKESDINRQIFREIIKEKNANSNL
jgi:glyceraldehyde-3-phosphate dehydrogenase (NADP+)